MKTIFGLPYLRQEFKDTIVSIGVFDGLHRGHRHLLKKSVSTARVLHKKAVCVTFDPHPQGQPYLISLKHRLRLIEELGMDVCLIIRFSGQFAQLSPESFVKDILVKFFHPLRIFVGDNFRFGFKAQGDVKLLKHLGRTFGFRVKSIKELSISRKKISSQRIRSLIRAGSLKKAEELLGRRVSVLGTVIKGSRRGRILGYPTANIDPHHEVLPKPGVYAVKVLYNAREYNGLCNIGRRPTFTPLETTAQPDTGYWTRFSVLTQHPAPSTQHPAPKKAGLSSPEERLNIEAHLFNFKKDIYAEDIEIRFIHKIRDEKKFSSSLSLSSQIKKDSQKALQWLL